MVRDPEMISDAMAWGRHAMLALQGQVSLKFKMNVVRNRDQKNVL